MPNLIDLSGKRFGRLVVLSHYIERKRTYWRCECDCGSRPNVLSSNLVRGLSKSCGCLRHDYIPPNKHGHTSKPAYHSWAAMIQRCTNPDCKNFRDWGGRGIEVCDRWRSFLDFYADMGDRPAGCTLERIDNDGNYEPGNCKWASRAEQSRNRRNVRKYEWNGREYTIPELAKEAGIGYFSFRQRLVVYGWSVHKSMTTPLSPSSP